MRWSQHHKPCGGAHLDCDEVACSPLRGDEGNSGFWIPILLTGKFSPGPLLHVGRRADSSLRSYWTTVKSEQHQNHSPSSPVPSMQCRFQRRNTCSRLLGTRELPPRFCSSWDHTADLALGLTALWPNCQAASWGVPAPWNKRKSLLSSGFPSVSWKVRALWDAQRCKMEEEFYDQISCETWVEKCVKQWWFLKKV